MIRSGADHYTIAAAGGSLPAGGYGFCASYAGGSRTSFPLILRVRDERGATEIVLAREGVYYQHARLFTQVDALTADGKAVDVVWDLGLEPHDFVNQGGIPADPEWSRDEMRTVTQPGGAMILEYVRPSWANKFSLVQFSAATGVVGPSIEQEFSDGSIQTSNVGSPGAFPAVLVGFGLPAIAAGSLATSVLIAAVIAASMLPPPAKVRMKWTAWNGTNVRFLARWIR